MHTVGYKGHQRGLPGGSPRIPLPASARREELVDAERHSAPWWCAESHPSDLCRNSSTFPQPAEAQVSELSSRKAARNKTIYKDHLYCSSVHLTFGMIFLSTPCILCSFWATSKTYDYTKHHVWHMVLIRVSLSELCLLHLEKGTEKRIN